MARILIVDDSAVMRKNLDIIFTQNGHKVIGEAVDGWQAIALYLELKPDLVTMDITMPKISGVEAVDQIIKIDDKAKIIMISALNQKQMVFEALKNGATHYVIKPIDPVKLMSIVNEVLGIRMREDAEKSDFKEKIEQGFIINNVNGYFEVMFNENLGLKDVDKLKTAVDGLLFIKPLKIVFDFNMLANISDLIINPIINMGYSVEKLGGIVEYQSENPELCSKLKEEG